MKKVAAIAPVLLAALAGCYNSQFPPSNFAECILDKMPGAANDAVVMSVHRICSQEHAGGYFAIERGSGRGWFGFDNPEACIIKKAADTRLPRAAMSISVACRCLYGVKWEEFDTCADPPHGTTTIR